MNMKAKNDESVDKRSSKVLEFLSGAGITELYGNDPEQGNDSPVDELWRKLDIFTRGYICGTLMRMLARPPVEKAMVFYASFGDSEVLEIALDESEKKAFSFLQAMDQDSGDARIIFELVVARRFRQSEGKKLPKWMTYDNLKLAFRRYFEVLSLNWYAKPTYISLSLTEED